MSGVGEVLVKGIEIKSYKTHAQAPSLLQREGELKGMSIQTEILV